MLKAVSVFGYLTMVAGILGLLVTQSLFSPSPLVVALQVGAVALLVWARITFGHRSFHFAANPTEGGLVTTGPYRYIRHPIYTAACLFTTVGGAVHPSWTTLLFGALVWAGAVARMHCEERLLLRRYPEYKQYAANTSRMIPFLF